MSAPLPIWRSLLYVPAHVDKYVRAAHRSGAHACILDLEDSVPQGAKSAARLALSASAAAVSQSGAAVLVRVNAEDEHLPTDVHAAVVARVRTVMLPKTASAQAVQRLDALLCDAERDHGLPQGATQVIALIEDVHALARLDEIATVSPRVVGLTLGSEDFSLSAGIDPCEQTLYGPSQQLVFACRRAGIQPFGFPGSIAQFRDRAAFAQTVATARRMGFVGGCAIHPDQVALLNEGMRPTEAELENARALVQADEHARACGQGAFEFRGRMVDAPVVKRAHDLLRCCAAITPARMPAPSFLPEQPAPGQPSQSQA